MTEVTLHFDAQPGMSEAQVAALSQRLRERCAELEEVETARSEPIRNRAFGVDDVLLVLAVSAKVFGAGALTLEALKRLIIAAKGVAEELGLGKLTVEGDGGRIAPEELTEDDARFISGVKP